MLTLRCCVVDDEPLAQELVASYIEKTPFMELVGKFSSAQDSVKTILEEDIDVVFLDIQMPQLNGMEFARIVPPTCRIIFTTAYDRYAIEGFKVNALDYLMKPISYEEFVGAANKALQWVELRRRADELDNNKRYIIVKSEYKQVQIPIDKIQFIEGLKDYVKIYVEGEKNAILTLTSMKTIERYLPAAEFLRVHRSFIVNTSKISIIERNRIVFGNHYIPVSESYKQAFNDYVAGYSLSAQRDNQPGED
ncbi:LytTR family DNA-binding domain-containing protein [uncultured Muribaculum sp.]|uniref:LytR/AlgR family response regulator transcription factor n=1 Tax=uncultured Muribaculum sp. TaxID=1918613 RepID=UPI0025AF8FD9|nr:LytTR family DNA-binding domain-containing protein [uncultured Muribaculum sp.]